MNGTVDGSIRRSPIEVGSLSHYLQFFFTFRRWLKKWDFWTIQPYLYLQFLACWKHWSLSPWKLTYPLKNDGWKMYFLLKPSPFLGDVLFVFRGPGAPKKRFRLTRYGLGDPETLSSSCGEPTPWGHRNLPQNIAWPFRLETNFSLTTWPLFWVAVQVLVKEYRSSPIFFAKMAAIMLNFTKSRQKGCTWRCFFLPLRFYSQLYSLLRPATFRLKRVGTQRVCCAGWVPALFWNLCWIWMPEKR